MEVRADRNSVYPMQPFTVTLSIAVKALPKPFDEKNPVTVQPAPPMLQIPWAIDEEPSKGLQPKIEWRRWLGAMENQRGAGFNVNNLGRESVFSLLNQQRSAFMPKYEKVRLPDKSGKETDYWRFEFRRTFVAKAVGPYTFGPASLKGTFATGLNEMGQPIGEDVYAAAKPLTVERPRCAPGRPARLLHRRRRSLSSGDRSGTAESEDG